MTNVQYAKTVDGVFPSQIAVKMVLDNLSRTKPPIIEYVAEYNVWRIWVSYNQNMSQGIHFVLMPDGAIRRVVLLPDGTSDVSTVTYTVTPNERNPTNA